MSPLNHILRKIPENLEEKDALRVRLRRVKDVFADRNTTTDLHSDRPISFAEGGCLLPPHPGVLRRMASAALHFERYTYQIYPQTTVRPSFLKEIKDYFQNHCRIPEETASNIAIGFGSSHIFDALLSVICDPGDVILTADSFYHSFAEWPTKWRGEMKSIQTFPQNGYKLDADDLDRWIESHPQPRVKCLVISNPTTTGAVYERAELEKIASVVRKRGLLVFCDEVFRDSEFSGVETVSLASLPEMSDYVITANSGSKTRGAADFRIGWACGPEIFINEVIASLERSITEVPLYLQAIGEEILRTPKDYLLLAAGEYQKRTELIMQQIGLINDRLNIHFGTNDHAYISVPYEPVSGHYICLNFNRFQNAEMPNGLRINDGADLAHYLRDPCPNSGAPGVVLSSGYSKGHKDLTAYLAFAQLGYEAVNDVLKGENIFSHSVRPRSDSTYTPEELERLHESFEVGREVLVHGLSRIERALMQLKPAARMIVTKSMAPTPSMAHVL